MLFNTRMLLILDFLNDDNDTYNNYNNCNQTKHLTLPPVHL